MAGPDLPLSPTAGATGHITHHAAIHALVNKFDKDAVPSGGQVPTWDSGTGLYVPATGSTDPEVVRDTMATALVAGSNVTITPNDAADTITIAATGGGVPAGTHGVCWVDDESGASDDIKFENALTRARNWNSNTGYGGTVMFSPRQYTFNSSHGLLSGDHLTSPATFADEPRSAGNVARVQCNVAGSAFTLSEATAHGIGIANIQFQGTSSTQWMLGWSANQLQSCRFHSLGFSLFQYVMGNPSQQLLLTACTFSGRWNTNNGYDRAYTLGGSDNTLWADAGSLLDSPPTTIGGSGTKYHLDLSFLDKTEVGGMYITGEQTSGMKIEGSATIGTPEGALNITNLKSEGRNAGAPTYGAALRITGGAGTLRDCWFSYAMSNPAAAGHSDGGVVHVNAGDWLISGCWYRRATGVAETVPAIYVGSTARVRVRDMRKSGSWTGLPLVKGAGTIDADNSVTVDNTA